jgi:hypothetical protein
MDCGGERMAGLFNKWEIAQVGIDQEKQQRHSAVEDRLRRLEEAIAREADN